MLKKIKKIFRFKGIFDFSHLQFDSVSIEDIKKKTAEFFQRLT